MNSLKAFSTALLLLVLLIFSGSAMAQGGPSPGPTPMTPPEQAASNGEQLTKITAQGTHIYLLCIYGARSPEVIIRSCNLKEAALRKAYERRDSNPKMKVFRLDNPSKQQLKNIRSNLGNKIAVVHVVAHSTLDEQKPDGVDVWDCQMSPTDFADIFPGSWVIWSGCVSRTICELADNILPSQCEIGWLHSDDEEWKKLYICLESLGGNPADRNEICSKVWGKDWAKDVKPPQGPGPGAGPGQ
ncbi:MAG: hypothetical protein CMH54_14810 [Myxococcales bacterium]|nr:hypothetical protein [Myxococcales bacterium]